MRSRQMAPSSILFVYLTWFDSVSETPWWNQTETCKLRLYKLHIGDRPYETEIKKKKESC